MKVAVLLNSHDEVALIRDGKIEFYGIIPFDPELPGLGGTIVPEESMSLFCDDKDKHRFPLLHEWSEYDCGSELWWLTDFGREKMYELCQGRYVMGRWTIARGHHFLVFLDRDKMVNWLLQHRNFSQLVVRDPDGNEKQIKLTVELV